MTTSKKTPEEFNEIMARVAPELHSEYAKYPLKRERWVLPTDTGPNSEPGFINADVDSGLKDNYVYGRGPNGKGYYHILTKQAYVILYSRLASSAPIGCCFGDSRRMADEHDDVLRVCHNRSVASVPDDEIAAANAICEAQGAASAALYF